MQFSNQHGASISSSNMFHQTASYHTTMARKTPPAPLTTHTSPFSAAALRAPPTPKAPPPHHTAHRTVFTIPPRKPKLKAKLGNWDIDQDLVSDDPTPGAAVDQDDLADMEFEAAMGLGMSDERRQLIGQLKAQKQYVAKLNEYRENKVLYDAHQVKVAKVKKKWDMLEEQLKVPTLELAGKDQNKFREMKATYERTIRQGRARREQELGKLAEVGPPEPIPPEKIKSMLGREGHLDGDTAHLESRKVKSYYRETGKTYQRLNIDNLDNYSRPLPPHIREQWNAHLGTGTDAWMMGDADDNPERRPRGDGKESARANVRFHYPDATNEMNQDDRINDFATRWEARDHPDFPILKTQGLPPLNKRYEGPSNLHIGIVQQRIKQDKKEEQELMRTRYVEKKIHNPSRFFDDFYAGTPPHLQHNNELGQFDPYPFTADTIHPKLRPKKNTVHKISELHPNDDDDSWYLHR